MNLPLPSLLEVITHVAASLFIDETLFYWGHRALHHPLLYSRFHKLHHRFYVPVGFSAEYFHPVDNLISNVIPLIAGPLLLGSHMITFWILTIVRVAEALDSHCGYDFWWSPFRYFPFRPSAEVHDFHHSANSGNYGGMMLIWDWLCGTDAAYKTKGFLPSGKVTKNRVCWRVLDLAHVSLKSYGNAPTLLATVGMSRSGLLIDWVFAPDSFFAFALGFIIVHAFPFPTTSVKAALFFYCTSAWAQRVTLVQAVIGN